MKEGEQHFLVDELKGMCRQSARRGSIPRPHAIQNKKGGHLMEKKRISFMGKLEVIADFKPTACNMCDFIALDQREVDCPHCCSLTGKRIYRTDARPPKSCPVLQRKGRKSAFRANGNAAAWRVYGMGTSRNYGTVCGRKHKFRLLDHKGKIRYRGVCIFPDDVPFAAPLRPLSEFGFAHGCKAISYKVGKRYNTIPLAAASRFDSLWECTRFSVKIDFLDMYALNDLTEAEDMQIRNFIAYMTES